MAIVSKSEVLECINVDAPISLQDLTTSIVPTGLTELNLDESYEHIMTLKSEGVIEMCECGPGDTQKWKLI